MTFGATSVISSEACSCSCFFGLAGLDADSESPGRRTTSVTLRRLPAPHSLLSV
jgi:hypothetical protein